MAETLRMPMTYLRGTAIGTGIGIIPGAGAAIASIVSYNVEKRSSKTPEKFGTGVLEGVAAPEAANNASVCGALVPLLSLGIPGSNSAAILVGAFMMQGMVPGPMLMAKEPVLVYGIFAAILIGLAIMFVFGMTLIPVWTRVLRVPQGIIAPMVLVIAVVGAYAYGYSYGSVIVALVFGVIVLLMRRTGFPQVPLILAVVLGEMIEINFRRSLMLSRGDLDIFFTRPVSLILFILIVLAFTLPLVRRMRSGKSK